MTTTIHSTEPHIDAHETKRRHRIVIEFDSTLAGAIGRRDRLADAIRYSDALPVYDNAEVSQPTVVGQTWTFFGHWDADELVIDHAVEGEHADLYPDQGIYSEGVWAASASGATIEEAEANVRAEYEDVEGCSCGMADKGAPGHDEHDDED